MLYDLLVNLQEVAFDFFEWQMEDDIEHIKRIPVFRVSREMMIDLIKKEVVVDKEFLNRITDETEKYNLEKIEYAALFSDGESSIVVEFNEKGENLFLSHLLPTDEEETSRYIKTEEEEEISYVSLKQREHHTFFTREERKIKNFLEKEITASYQKKEYSKLRYLYLEYFEKEEENPKKIKEALLSSIQHHLTKKHLSLYEVLLMVKEKKAI